MINLLHYTFWGFSFQILTRPSNIVNGVKCKTNGKNFTATLDN